MAKTQKLLDVRDFSTGVKCLPSLTVPEKDKSFRFVRTQNRAGISFSDPIEKTTFPRLAKASTKFKFNSDQGRLVGEVAALSLKQPGEPGQFLKTELKSQRSENSDIGYETNESAELSIGPKHKQPPYLPKKLLKVVEWKDIIGYGTFGDVYRGFWHEGQKDIAIKIVKLSRDIDVENYKREIKIWRDLRHTLLLRLYKYYFHTQTATVYMFMELAKHGSLYNHIEKTRKSDGIIELNTIVDWASDILQALEYLHDKNIAHRDLKSPNVVLCDSHVRKSFRAKICDFGTSRIIDHTTQATGLIGSTRWMAPEIMRGEKYNVKCDIYSFGVLLWEMLTCQVPFHNKTNPYALMWSVLEVHERPELPEMKDWPATRRYLMNHVVESCWEDDPDKRPSAKKLTEKLLQYRDLQ